MFEFVPNKSEGNKVKHGIDFVEAQALWQDRNATVFPVSYPVEDRHLLLSMFRQKIWAAIFTRRGSNIRIISVRRARKTEEVHYYENRQKDRNGSL